MPELVMVIPDLYLPRELRGGTLGPEAFTHVPGIECVARFGTRERLGGGWRDWLLGRVGRADLEGTAPACIAAAGLEEFMEVAPADAHQPVDAYQPAATQEVSPHTRWIATAVHLQAGLTRVHLEHRGLLRLAREEQAALVNDFARTFGSSRYTLAPLPSGEFLLNTPGLAAIETLEPARCAGGEIEELVPAGPTTGPLRRLLAEIEMWLHTQPLNEARRARSEPPVNALWPWGAVGRIVRAARRAPSELPLAFARDAWLEGLWRLQGSALQAPPERLGQLLAAGMRASVLVVGVGGELHRDQETVADALSRLDERFVDPALQALRRGALDGLTLILNDVRVRIQRGGLRRFWRRARSGLGGFA